MTVLRDVFLLLVVFGLPAYLVIRFGGVGLLLGILAMWALPLVAGEIQRGGDPDAERFAMGVWMVFGWVFAALYCVPLYLGKLAIVAARKKRRERAPPERGREEAECDI